MGNGKAGRKRRPSSSTKGGSTAKPKTVDMKKVWAAAPKRGVKPKTFGPSSSRPEQDTRSQRG